jgi:methylmalonyl-CoA mutase cobalamin-binding domain/chain
MSMDLGMAIVELKRDEASAEVQRRVQAGEDALAVLSECRRGMALVGERYQSGEYFLSELLLSAEIFKEAVRILEPYLAGGGTGQPVAKVVLASLSGDIHDLGKNILATLLRAHSFEVHDLGVNVSPAVLVKKVAEVEPDFVGFSALVTTAFPSMKEAVDRLGEAGTRSHLKVMIGGGVTTPAVKDYVGADFQTCDASEGVSYCQGILAKQGVVRDC